MLSDNRLLQEYTLNPSPQFGLVEVGFLHYVL